MSNKKLGLLSLLAPVGLMSLVSNTFFGTNDIWIDTICYVMIFIGSYSFGRLTRKN